jgi:IS30 family transposase
MKQQYRQLTLQQRYQIQAEQEVGFSQTKTAKSIGCNKSTVSREIKRCKQGYYSAESAHKQATLKRRCADKATLYTAELWDLITGKLKDDWSPSAIAGRIEIEGGKQVSHETIYQWIYKDKKRGGEAHNYLLRAYRGFRKKRKAHDGRGLLQDRVSIDQRPIAANKRLHTGHWEGDTVHGVGGNFVTLTDRRTRLLDAKKTQSRTKKEVGKRLVDMLSSHGAKTLTVDNGREFYGHKSITEKTGVQVYFADPYASWQRGSNENANGLLRRYFPKGTDFRKVSAQALRRAVEKINFMPRKLLKWKSAYEVHYDVSVALIT